MENIVDRETHEMSSGEPPSSKVRFGSTPNGPERMARLRKSMHKTASKRFSIQFSTEERNKTDEKVFYGPYQHLKKQMDYEYHSYYRKERQWLHDSIIEDYLCHEEQEEKCVPAEPWLIYTCGVKGAGKRYLIDHLMGEGRLPLLSTIIVDGDEIRRSLPEFSAYAETNPELLGKRMDGEAGYICEILTLAALQAGSNVLIDGQLSDVLWRLRQFQKLRDLYPKLRVALVHVTAPLDVIVERSEERAKVTGFHIPLEHTKKLLETMDEHIEMVVPEVDYFCTIRNGGGDSELDGGETWENFTATFQQEVEVSGRTAFPPSDDDSPEKPQKPPPLRRLASRKETRYAATSFRMRRKSLRRPFSVDVSTEENHKSDDHNYYGKYSHIRETLDYSYHCNYTYERQKFQDRIVTEFLHGAVITDKDGQLCTTPTEPWLVFTAGAMGAGKSYTMRNLVEKKRFPLIAFITVDPDQIRQKLPEFHLYVDSNPELAGTLTHKEAGFIAEILTLAGLQSGKNVMVDGSLRNSEWYKTYFKRLRLDFPILRLGIIHVTAPREAIFQRAEERALVTGRVVPRDVLEMAMEQVPKSVKILAPLVDYFVELENGDNEPDILIKTEGETWANFQSKWVQACAWVPGKKKKEKLMIKKTISVSSAGGIC